MIKNIFIVGTFLFFNTSCCKVDLAIGVSVDYSGLTGAHQLEVIRQSKLNPADSTKIMVHELNDLNNHSVFVDFDESDEYCYILQVDSALHSDTICNFSYKTEGRNCRTHVESVSYRLNGDLKTDMKLTIN